MKAANRYRLLILGGILIIALLALRYLLPLALPFLVGLMVAWMAEPVARFLAGRGKFPRGLAAGTAIGGVYLILLALVYLLGRLALQEMDHLATGLPQVMEGLDETASRVQNWLYGLAQRAPERLRPGLEESIAQLFSNGSALADGAVTRVLGAASRVILTLPDTFVFLGTAVLSSFMISAQLPRLRPFLQGRLPPAWSRKILPVLHNLKVNVGGWFRAQCKLMVLTFFLLTIGFFILRVEFPLLLGALIALVDALPMLGTGTVLVPWGLLVMLQGQTALGLGLIALYGVTSLTRSILEPRMVGRQLGLNPLLTLVALYMGYRLWGILGMILAPVLTITALEIWSLAQPERTTD